MEDGEVNLTRWVNHSKAGVGRFHLNLIILIYVNTSASERVEAHCLRRSLVTKETMWISILARPYLQCLVMLKRRKFEKVWV